MLEFILGASAATLVSKKFKNKSKDEIKEILAEGLNTTSKVISAGVELATDKINNSIVSGKETNETINETVEPESKVNKLFND